ncbi:MCD, Malonyl-CoA decarboxylase MCD [Phyllobacterium brassicacearum]|uniref:MCD, Malonyl-CoA decarboxylase MCD n=1 Tax=Phyllobacterium brassicacearum TaxID=314235 RepID=A0A2P7BWA8_9HYPH|nr:malonyl-CoA decarboxylase [Phyllobacterium brassicacearum]PSH70744.1 MCD, Malonyl-CoA decarboxylase MCD [Phyllobacterium brassicacearum]TDQ35778.1 malonyl-CoA decarboxylase [Phyllobacterium brassicacearum]
MTGTSFFSDMVQTITERGRKLLSFAPRAERLPSGISGLERLCEMLLSSRGEASGMALAAEILQQWLRLSDEDQRKFMLLLFEKFGPDPDKLDAAIEAYRAARTSRAVLELHQAAEPRRQELIRRLNLAPSGISTLVRMRERLLRLKADTPDLETVDADFAHLFASWFNRGFLILRPIDWSTPAHILEKIIRYEAVHEIGNWDELRRRLAPADRRCFAFFHPQLADDPLIFVEVALTRDIPENISAVLDETRAPIQAQDARTAVFYSISNCQAGLRGISFGNFLIKQVVEDLRRDLPKLDTFVTLSPVPGFSGWLTHERRKEHSEILSTEEQATLAALDDAEWSDDPAKAAAVRAALMPAAAWYFFKGRTTDGRPIDPVARFHLGNGARLERMNFLGDTSSRAMRQAHGLMVNYLYKLDDIEANHEAFAQRNEIVAAPGVRKLLRSERSGRSFAATSGTNTKDKQPDKNKANSKELSS